MIEVIAEITESHLMRVSALGALGRRVETVEASRKEYKELLNEGWKKASIFNSYF